MRAPLLGDDESSLPSLEPSLLLGSKGPLAAHSPKKAASRSPCKVRGACTQQSKVLQRAA